MRILVQRVKNASVTIDGQLFSQIKQGYLLLVGFSNNDDENIVELMTQKLLNLRICDDSDGKMNLSIIDTKGELLSVSQFTLYANCRKGNRPSFIEAGAPDEANKLYEYIISEASKQVPVVEHGILGADMKVSLENDGPFTVIFDENLRG